MISSSLDRIEQASSVVEISNTQDRTRESSLQDIPADDVLQYVKEMCVTLSYMSIAHNFAPLSRMLDTAGEEAKRQLSGSMAAQSAQEAEEVEGIGVPKGAQNQMHRRPS